MEKELQHSILQKAFIELTMQEKEAFKDLFTNEEEFNQLKAVFPVIIEENLMEVSFKTKNKLDLLFEAKYSSKNINFFHKLYPLNQNFIARPLVQIAAIGIIVLLAVPFLLKPKVKEHEILAMTKMKLENSRFKEKNEKPSNYYVPNQQINKKSEVSSNTEIAFVSPMINNVADSAVENIDAEQFSNSETREFKFAESNSKPEFEDNTMRGIMSVVPQANAWSGDKDKLKNHSDGIYIPQENSIFSMAADKKPELLDLLTAAF
ncbi:MAG: hypothetical protein HYR91_03260 [Flavobacteriia bacterium]|nr:hypothetical protein [Flavobacteriia bacterium]